MKSALKIKFIIIILLLLGLNLLYNAVKYPAIRGLSVRTKVKVLVGGTESEIYRRSISN